MAIAFFCLFNFRFVFVRKTTDESIRRRNVVCL